MPKSPNGELLMYVAEDGTTQLEVRLENDTIWLTQQQIAELFQSSRTNVIEHIRNIFHEGELDESATCRKFRQVAGGELSEISVVRKFRTVQGDIGRVSGKEGTPSM